MESNFIFNDGKIKSRLVKIGKNPKNHLEYYVSEYKSAIDKDAQWFPWIVGTAEWLGLTEQEISWAK